jgi:aryl-alcohol dehydrogenase-like predicted oxidoreductase
LLDWAMIILNPLEPWPGSLCLPAAVNHDVKVITRVVDHGGLFHDDVKPGHKFGQQDHRAFRPPGWVEAGNKKLDEMRPFAEKYGVTMLQLACLWNLAHSPVKSVIPTLIEEVDGKPIEEKVHELASLPDKQISEEDRERISHIGNNKGCMDLKGASRSHTGEPQADRWSLTNDLELVAKRWGVDPATDLAYTHAPTKAA